MKWHISCFLGKIRKNNIISFSAEFAQRMVKVKGGNLIVPFAELNTGMFSPVLTVIFCINVLANFLH